MASSAQTLYLIDGHAQLYRAYHAVQARMFAADRKTPTNAVFGFGNMMRNLRSRFKPDLLAAIFDPHGPVKREELYQKYADKLGPAFSGYKTQRDAMPDDLRPQIDLALELCTAYGVPAIQVEGYEADDVLGTLATKAAAQGINAVIVTGDKDLLQLVCDGIKIFDPMKDITFDAETVESVKGVKPGQIIDWLGFMGDSSDNIPGVSGVGEQTAVKLLQQHGSMDKALAFYREKFKPQESEILDFVAAHESESGKAKEERKPIKPPKGIKVVDAYLFAQHERARASRELARLTIDLPIELDLEKLHCKPPEAEKLAPLLKRLEFKSFERDLDKESLARFEAKAQAEAPPPEKTFEVHYTIVDDEKKLAAFSKQFAKQKQFAVGTQTTGGRPHDAHLLGVAISWAAHEAFYLPVTGPLDSPTSAKAMRRSIGALNGVPVGPTVFFATRASCTCAWKLRPFDAVAVALRRKRLSQ